MGKGKRVDVYLEVRRGRGIYFLNETSACANIARRVFGNLVQAIYFERFHWSIWNFWTLQTAEHAVQCSVAVMLHGL